MAVIRPFRAVRPDPAAAPRVAAVPYDVVDTGEARALAGGNPLSFLPARMSARQRRSAADGAASTTFSTPQASAPSRAPTGPSA